MRCRLFLLLASCALLLACAGTAQQPVETPTAETGVIEPEEALNDGGEIDRDELLRFLDRGPAHLLRSVPVTPRLDGDALVGFRIESFFADDERFSRVDIQAGDVVVAVNGSKIEKPGDLYDVWEALRTAPRLQLDVIRGNTLRILTWEIIDATEQTPAEPTTAPTSSP